MTDTSKMGEKADSPLAFSLPLLFCPLLVLGWIYGGVMLILAPIFGYVIISIIDLLIGENKKDQILNSENINNYKIILFAWPFIQFFYFLAQLLLFVFLIICLCLKLLF